MNPQELRIGNLIQCSISKQMLTVDKITSNSFEIKVLRSSAPQPSHGWKPTPIQLTHDILCDLEFDYLEDLDLFQLESDSGFTIHGSVYDGLSVFCNDTPIGRVITSVHKLQNIWYALTGNELISTE